MVRLWLSRIENQIDSASSIGTCEATTRLLAFSRCMQNDIGLIPGGIVSTLWSSLCMTTGQAPYDENWLLAYEANIKACFRRFHGRRPRELADPRLQLSHELAPGVFIFMDLLAAARHHLATASLFPTRCTINVPQQGFIANTRVYSSSAQHAMHLSRPAGCLLRKKNSAAR